MHHRVVVNGLRVSWILITIWYELVIFLSSVRHCHWPDLARSSLAAVGHSSTHVLLVADPQILDHRSYPERGPYLTYLTRLVVDLNLRKNWWAALQKRPDAIVFLGDMMDGGRFNMSDEEYEEYYGRFQSIFAIPTGVPTYFIPGNHDVGLRASSSFSPHARSRYISHFGPLNSRVTIANHTFVLLDAPGLVEEDIERQRHGRTYATWTPRAGGPVEFVRSIARENGNDPVVLLSHIPLSRDAFDCGPLREKGTIRQGIGLGYQNTLEKEATAFLLEELRPSVVFSGDDHDYCEIWHPSLVDNAASQIREVSVKSLSMAMGIQRPGFQLLSLAPQGHLEDATIAPKRHADAPCVLPDQLTIYLSAYIPLLLASLFILLVANTIRVRSSRSEPRPHRRRSSSPQLRLSVRSREPGELSEEPHWKDDSYLLPEPASTPSPRSLVGRRCPPFTFGRRRRIMCPETLTRQVLDCLGANRTRRLQMQRGFWSGFVRDTRDVAGFPLTIFIVISLSMSFT